MQVREQKCKIISFRLSVSQYERIQEICRTSGYESVSWLARLALLRLIPSGSYLLSYEQEIDNLRRRLDLLQEDLRRYMNDLPVAARNTRETG